MATLLDKIAARVMPFIVLAVLIVLFILGFFIFSYILIFAAIVGLVLYGISVIRRKFFGHKSGPTIRPEDQVRFQGRIIEYDEDK